jgi:formylglycine-generating enzyme required for sulfatase activity
MRESIATRPATVLADRVLPDPSTLKPLQKGAPFTNTLGMSFKEISDSLYLSLYETRIQDYEAFMSATHRTWERRPTFEMKPNHPIVNVSWEDASKFCQWLTETDRAAHLIGAKDVYRLPTDAEWSLAVGLKNETGSNPAEKHLANTTDYPWGTSSTPPPLSANLDSVHLESYSDSFPYTAPVGSFTPNALGIYDMAGNVAEWCADVWPGAPNERVVRGSSWLTSNSSAMLSSYRNHVDPSALRTDLGFRVVLSLEANTSQKP